LHLSYVHLREGAIFSPFQQQQLGMIMSNNSSTNTTTSIASMLMGNTSSVLSPNAQNTTDAGVKQENTNGHQLNISQSSSDSGSTPNIGNDVTIASKETRNSMQNEIKSPSNGAVLMNENASLIRPDP